MFKYKTDAQLEAMSAAERDTYAEEKRAHEAGLAKSAATEAANEAVKTARTEMEKTFDEKVKTVSDALEIATKANTDLEAIVIKQGEELAKRQSFSANTVDPQEFKTEIEALRKKSVEGLVSEKVQIKAISGDNVISIGDVPNAAGNGVIAGALASVRGFFAQLIPGIFTKPVPTSNILDYCDTMPLEGNQLVAISETSTINVAITPEGAVKPVSLVTWAVDVENAVPAASIWKSTDQMRRFFMTFLNSFYNTIIKFFDKVIPARIWAKIDAAAVAFTPSPAQKVVSPNNFDAIVQVIASIKHLGYMPNCVKLSDFAYANMKGLKATDGHYMLANQGSINLLDGSIQFGKQMIPIETDSTIADDVFYVGDFTSVKVAIDNNLDYVEAYVGDDMETNKKTHRLEKYVAVIVPTALRSGIVKDTFTNVKTLITV